MADSPQTTLESPAAAPEFQYIEDPQIAELLRDLSSRWPFLIAADHPLTEFFIHRIGRPGVIRPLLHNLRWILGGILGIGMVMLGGTLGGHIWRQYGFIAVISYMFIVISTLLLLKWSPHYVRGMRSPEEILSKDPSQNCWIWLSAIGFSEYLAIVAAVRYWWAMGLHRNRFRIGIGYLAINALVYVYFHYAQLGDAYETIAIQFMFLGSSIVWFITDPAIAMFGALHQIGGVLKSQESRAIYVAPALVVISMTIALITAIEASMIIAVLCSWFPVMFIILSHHYFVGRTSDLVDAILRKENKFIELLVPEYDPGAED